MTLVYTELELLQLNFLFCSVINNIEQNVLTTTTKFSHVSTIKYPKIDISQGGDFKCQGFLHENLTPDLLHINITVFKTIQPYKHVNFNMNGTTLILNKGEKMKLDCSIIKGARPTPIITWTKGGFISYSYT